MKTKHALEIAGAYLSGEISPEDKGRFETWLEESPAHMDIFNDVQKIWNYSTLKFQLDDAATEEELQKLFQRIEAEGKSNPVRSLFVNHWLKIAASIALLLTAYWMLKLTNTSTEETIAQGESVVESNDNGTTLYLPDSTQVKLGRGSKLSYGDNFGEEMRQVHLDGEGYFVVVHDIEHPFLVINDNAVIRVVGTTFNVKEDSLLTVTVTEGKVELYSREFPNDRVLVERSEAAYLAKREGAKPVKITTEKSGKEPPLASEDNAVDERESKDDEKEIESGESIIQEQAEETEDRGNEIENPPAFLSVESMWSKNQFSQSVVEGTIVNKAKSTTYKNIVLSITYKKANGKVVSSLVTVYETIHPGEKVDFRKNLYDMFTKAEDLKVEVDHADVDSQK